MVYGYATGRIKVLETKLFTKARVERLIQAHDLAEQINILADTDYGDYFDGVRGVVDVEEALNKYLAKVYDFLEEVCKKKEIIKFFRLKYDYHNLKVLLKKEYLGEENNKIWFYLGLLDIEKTKQAVQKEALEAMPDPYKSDIAQAIAEFEKEKDAQVIDLILDRGLYREWYKIAQYLKNKFLLDFVKITIDLGNLRTFLRAKNLGKEPQFVVKALFEHGSIKKERLISLYMQALNKSISDLSNTDYAPILNRVIKEQVKVDLELLDRLSDNFILEYAKKAKLVAVGPEPLVGYILAKENEVNATRIALLGKLNRLPVHVIEERIRELYA